MFSRENRCIYRRHQLGEVICQLRFPEILSIEANLPVEFQEQIRDDFPQYAARKESLPPKITGAAGNYTLENQPQTTNYYFISADGAWKLNLTSRFLSLSCNRYTCWEDFAGKLDKPLSAFIQIYHPAYFERVGLRYMNFFDRKSLGLEDVPYRELFTPLYLGPYGYDQVPERAVSRFGLDMEFALMGGCKAKIHAGPGMVRRVRDKEPAMKYILDMDLYMPGKVLPIFCAPSLNTMHGQSYGIFRGAITDTLHDAMEPESI